MHLQEVGCGSNDWNVLAQVRDSWRVLWIRYWTFVFNKMREIC